MEVHTEFHIKSKLSTNVEINTLGHWIVTVSINVGVVKLNHGKLQL